MSGSDHLCADGNVFAADPYKSEAIAFATKKQVTRTSTTSSSAALAATGLSVWPAF